MKKAIVGILACAIAFGFAGCAGRGGGPANEAVNAFPTIVRIEGANLIAGNMTLGYLCWMTLATESNPGALLARDGDLLIVAPNDGGNKGEPFIMPWSAEDGGKMALRLDGPRLLLGGRVVSLLLRDEAGWEWLSKAPDRALKGLRFITLDAEVPEGQLGELERLALLNPHVGLSLRDAALLARVPALDPRWLQVNKGQPGAKDLDTLSQRKAIETLLLGLDDSDLNLGALAALPGLRRLTLDGYNPEKSPLPALPRLESLTLIGKAPADLTSLAPMTGLLELNFFDVEKLSFKGIEALPKLESLGLIFKDEAVDLAGLDAAKGLRRLAIGWDVPQEKFDHLMRTHPGLQAVELLKCEGIKDAGSLAMLHDLKGLVFLAENASIGPLGDMKQLRLLILPKKLFEEKPAEVARLRARLPDCVIAEGEPFCMGSGRILLLVPFVALGWILCARRRKCAA